MSKTYRPWDPDQTYLLPPSPRDWLPDGDLVYFMLDVVQTLDLGWRQVHYLQSSAKEDVSKLGIDLDVETVREVSVA